MLLVLPIAAPHGARASCGPREVSAIIAAQLGLGDSGIHSPLPAFYIQKLRETAAAKALSDTFHRGGGLTLDVYTSMGAGGLGESTQALFLTKVLREMLPDAVIHRSDPYVTNGPDGAIRLYVTDSAEAGRYSRWMSD